MTEVIARPPVELKPIELPVQDCEPGPGSINRDVPIPYYYQLEGLLRDQVRRGRWLPGERVPSEKELCDIYAVSRTVVRQAVGDLVQEGLLYHLKGKGTFVRRRPG
jgi:GntR family transcriptional regulator